ncbi:Hypothetical predicted protein [Lecanosticta acicola]|uniref:Transmembrane protein n=1 Tax=Lecanosticta acicola TaxID=111012 RepID=A0AAI8YY29_9PEZI|nr:Hypothetical predicted protein [Lecanosticta acicola]
MISSLLRPALLASTAYALALPQSANYDTSTSPGGGSAVNSDAGASGGTAGFTLSTGGLVAIIIVVVAGVIFGVTTTALFVIAKRRQWTMRQTMRRASRKVADGLKTPLTPRFPRTPAPVHNDDKRRTKRSGVQMESIPAKQGRGVVVEVKQTQQPGANKGEGFMGKLRGNDWR